MSNRLAPNVDVLVIIPAVLRSNHPVAYKDECGRLLTLTSGTCQAAAAPKICRFGHLDPLTSHRERQLGLRDRVGNERRPSERTSRPGSPGFNPNRLEFADQVVDGQLLALGPRCASFEVIGRENLDVAQHVVCIDARRRFVNAVLGQSYRGQCTGDYAGAQGKADDTLQTLTKSLPRPRTRGHPGTASRCWALIAGSGLKRSSISHFISQSRTPGHATPRTTVCRRLSRN